jgi:hypothetical protein
VQNSQFNSTDLYSKKQQKLTTSIRELQNIRRQPNWVKRNPRGPEILVWHG